MSDLDKRFTATLRTSPNRGGWTYAVMRSCEVWESEEAHGRYLKQVGPFFQEIGIPPPSKVTVVPLLRHLGTK
ncbi:MAG: hypothetical protein ABI949_00485 [Ilumatobacteraceae bacterium]